ncbi:MAG: hypothetical protein JJU45_17060 [Acidimicrobiia bacterium]|nr:hypothetical protein [Acidimicrobiia bacterium]
MALLQRLADRRSAPSPSGRRPRRGVALLAVVALVASACGSDDAEATADTTAEVTTSLPASGSDAHEAETSPTDEPDDERAGNGSDPDTTDGATDGAARRVATALDRTRRLGTWRVEITQDVVVAGRSAGTGIEVVHDAATGRSEVRSDAVGGFEVAGGDPLAGLWERVAGEDLPDGALDPAALLDVVDAETPGLVRAVGAGDPVDGRPTDRYELTTSLARLVGDRLSDTDAAAWLAEVGDQVGLGSSGAPSWVPDAVRDPWDDWVAPSATGAAERLVSIPVGLAVDVDEDGLLRRVTATVSMGTVVGVLLDGPVVRRAADLAESKSAVTFLEPL